LRRAEVLPVAKRENHFPAHSPTRHAHETHFNFCSPLRNFLIFESNQPVACTRNVQSREAWPTTLGERDSDCFFLVKFLNLGQAGESANPMDLMSLLNGLLIVLKYLVINFPVACSISFVLLSVVFNLYNLQYCPFW
jgi:hypothetical protein